MEDYEKLYFSLFNKVTDVIEQLKAAQQKAESDYLGYENEGSEQEQ